jgi:hypothetical protein
VGFERRIERKKPKGSDGEKSTLKCNSTFEILLDWTK